MSGAAGANRSRDRELVELIGRYGALTVPQLQRAMDVGRTATYRRIARCEEAGLVERLRIAGVGPVLLATRDGLRYAGLGLPVATVTPANVVHTLRCAGLGIATERNFPGRRLLTEREIVFTEQLEGRPIASARIGTVHGRPRYHRADLAVLHEDGVIVAEVELTPKAPVRLGGIIAAWRRARHVHRVEYFCAPGQTHRAVQRAVAKRRAQGRVIVRELKR